MLQVKAQIARGDRGWQSAEQTAGICQREFGVDLALEVVGIFTDAGNLGHEQQFVGL